MIFRSILALMAALVLTGLASGAQAQTAAADPAVQRSRCSALTQGQYLNIPGAPTIVMDANYRPKTEARQAVCDILGYVNPQNQFGVYMPAETWNGKVIVRGCGGSCGMMAMEQTCGKHARDGYACIFTSMGHIGTQSDNAWLANNLDGQIDFGYRSTHVTTVAGKALIKAFYGTDLRRSYFYGCSTGGRQALIEAQRFPQDFDGIVAVAPASMGPYTGGQSPAFGNFNTAPDGAAILPDLKAPLLYKAVIAQCDANDGVIDGLVDPRGCKFDPAALQCKAGEDTPKCLTPEQVQVARQFYERGQVGSELNWINGWTAKPQLKPSDVDPQYLSRGDPVISESMVYVGNPDLTPFKARGGKLILTHGSTDIVVPGAPSLNYYELATRTMGGPEATKAFFRFFVIPGMDHCTGGDAAWGVDYIAAIDDWVDKGKAPDRLVGTRPKLGVTLDYFGLDVRLLKPDQIAFSRSYFPHPMQSFWDGKGDPTKADSYKPALSRPKGQRVASAGSGAPPTAAELSARLLSIIALTEDAYGRDVVLPPKNITDRIGKAVRRAVYTSGASDRTVAEALTLVESSNLSPVAKAAIALVRPEYPQAG